MVRNPVVYVRRKVWHPDHATIRLDIWHRVEMNTENWSRAMASVAFLDGSSLEGDRMNTHAAVPHGRLCFC